MRSMFGRLVAHHAAAVVADVPRANIIAPDDEDVRPDLLSHCTALSDHQRSEPQQASYYH